MDTLLRDLSWVAAWLWPLILVSLWWIDRRLTAIKTSQKVMLALLTLLLDAHHLTNGDDNAPVLIRPD